ncbi:hypothetical protein [Actinoplanes sp. NPDC051859]|uniref:hypothetical protein n=1 Tax=Actinoplanes sp. NPDC051859 TaxID=3363909 RepID=UPI00379A7BE9
MSRPATRIAALAIVVLTLTGCFGGDVETRTEDEAKALVRDRSAQLATQLGGVAFTEAKENPGPCTSGGNADVFAVQGSYQAPLPTAEQIPTLNRIRDAWKRDGWEITDDRVIEPNAGILRAKSSDGYTYHLTSARSTTELGVIIYSPCFESPTPR